MNRILLSLCTAAIFTLSGCNVEPVMEPQHIAEAQFRAFAGNHLKNFDAYFTAEVQEQLHSLRMVDADTIWATYASTGEREILRIAAPMPDYAVPPTLGMLPQEAVTFEVLSLRQDKHTATVEARISYPDALSLLRAYGESSRAEEVGAMVTQTELSPVQRDSVKKAAKAKMKEALLVAYRAEPERFRREIIGEYQLVREKGQWKVVREPITAGLLQGRS